jgi:Fe-S oxidoreductase
MDFNLALKLLLAVLSIAAGVLFWKPFGGVCYRILRSKHEPEYTLDHLFRRCWRVFWEILCQAQVIRDRPLPGLAHAFLLWAFCAFLLAEIDELAVPFGFTFLNRQSAFGLFYFWFVFLFASCCTVSIIGLAFRRYVVKSEWLDPDSYQTNLTLGLIFVVMVTLLPRWWVSEGSLTGRSLWWLHTLALLTLLVLIPRSKNLHIFLSPLALFLKSEGLSRIPPLAGPRDLGIYSGQDITRLTALQAYSCVECGRCTEHCPAYNTGKELDPRLIALGINYYLDEYGPRNPTPILDVAISPQAVFECTTCGACEAHCPAGIQHLSMIIGLRRGGINSEAWQDDSATQLFEKLQRRGNALGASETERNRFIAAQQLPIFDGSQEYCLWLGCMGAYDPRGRAIIASFANVMKHLGTSFGVLSREFCTGDPTRRLGNDAITVQLANANLRILREVRARKIVSICPHCVRTIAEDWYQIDQGPAEDDDETEATIEHHSEFLARHADRLPKENSGQQVAFHDPCYLGRYRDVYDEPRQVIACSAELVEPPRTRDRSFCCGAGGGLAFLGEENGQKMNEERAKELAGTGAGIIATACPFCSAVLRDALPAGNGQLSPQFLDIAQIVAGQLKPTEPRR